MTQTKKLIAAVAAGTLMLALAGCGDDSATNGPQATQTATNGDVFNDADVEFATSMIPHHAQALTMVDLTRGRDLSPEVARLAEEIQAAQGPEIETMVGWLNDWGKPVPGTMRDHGSGEDMGGHDMGDMGDTDSSMPGMMSDQEMADLEAASGQDFEDMWLQMMIRHHEGAIEMAGDVQRSGMFEAAMELAEAIETSQQAEIEQMRDLLAS